MTAVAAVSLTRDVLVGEWHNTNADGLLSRIAVRESADGGIEVQSFARLAAGEADWGAVPASIYSFKFDAPAGEAFSAVHELAKVRVSLQANVKSGVLVVAFFAEFHDASGRIDHFDREFFHRVHP